MTMEELTKEMEALGQPSFRAKQIYSWLHEKTVQDFDEMKNLPKTLRKDLAGRYILFGAKKVQVQESKIDGTRKYLFALADGMVIESVWMKYHHGNSVCISSQVGCRMGCRFCASTIDGLERNLRPSEMLSQIYEIQKDTAERVSNVVIMGSGEPMDNYDYVVLRREGKTSAREISRFPPAASSREYKSLPGKTLPLPLPSPFMRLMTPCAGN